MQIVTEKAMWLKIRLSVHMPWRHVGGVGV